MIKKGLADPKVSNRMVSAYAVALARLENREPNDSAIADYFMGQVTDTFNLSIVGPLSQAASIASNVTLAAGAQQNIPITLNPAGYLVASNVLLQVSAVSQTVPAVQNVFSTTVAVPSSQSVSASIVPSPSSVSSAPGSVALRLLANRDFGQ